MYMQDYSGVALPVSRRLDSESEVNLAASQFGQPVDIQITLADGEVLLPNMPDYPRRSLAAALKFIYTCKQTGMNKFLIRIVEGKDQVRDSSLAACLARIQRQGDAIATLRRSFPDAEFFIDPFGIALGNDDQWGAVNGDGKLCVGRTEEMFAAAVKAYAQAGASYVLTLGRFHREVAVARQIIDGLQSDMGIITFSTNTESSQAYAYLPDCAIYRDSRQKVLPGNPAEMLLWSLCDIAAGATTIGIKPSDNVHILLRLIQLVQCGAQREQFFASGRIARLADRSSFVCDQIGKLRQEQGRLDVSFATYAISGVYAADMVVQARKGESFLLTLLFERFVAIASTAGMMDESVTIFDRNAQRFLAAAA